MSLAPLLAAPPAVVWHAVAALSALAIGIVQMVGPKGTTAHRLLGWLWVAMMAAAALSSFLINEMRWFGPFGPIHLLAILTLVNLPIAVIAARRGRISVHSKTMRSLFVFALVGAGLFTLMPGRLMGEVVFGWPSGWAEGRHGETAPPP